MLVTNSADVLLYQAAPWANGASMETRLWDDDVSVMLSEIWLHHLGNSFHFELQQKKEESFNASWRKDVRK